MANSYTELWPAQLDSYADVGTSQTITAEFRIYPGSDGREYDLVSPEDGTVTYYWHYDDDNFRIYDKDGKQVGNDDESGAYIGSDASTGSACDFTIYRKRQGIRISSWMPAGGMPTERNTGKTGISIWMKDTTWSGPMSRTTAYSMTVILPTL